jgi:tRNA(Ile2) C34 agmatinyltransferase TiaS
MSPTLAPPPPAPTVEMRDCLVCGGNYPAAIGRTGYRCLTCKSEYVNPDTKSPWRSR